MVAGVIGALLRRKKGRTKRQKLDKELLSLIPHKTNIVIEPFPRVARKWVTSKEAAALATKKAANEALKKLILGQEIQKQQRLQKHASQDAVSQVSCQETDDGPFGSSGSAYNAIYLGLVLICIGCVITFVGLGEKGFKTLELKMIGPALCLAGLACITLKIIHCSFPQMFKVPSCLKKAKLTDSDRSNLMGKGVQNGHFGKKETSPKVLSPRLQLQSSKKTTRPTSTIPNYIGNGEDSSENDDFDPGRSRPHSNRYNNAFEQSPQRGTPPASKITSNEAAAPSAGTPVAVFNPSSKQLPQQKLAQEEKSRSSPQNAEILLSPQGLIL